MNLRSAPGVGELLRACVAEHDWSRPLDGVGPLPAAALTALLRQSGYHGVTNAVHLSLRTLPLDAELLGALEQRYLRNVGRHLRILADLTSLREALDDAGVPWMAFKGPVLSEVIYPRADLRSYVDLDVLVERSIFAAAVDALEGRGFRLLDRNWDLIGNEERGQLHVVLPFGTLADVHWHLLNRGTVRRSLSVPMDDVFAGARTVKIDGAPVRTLGAVHTLVHLCVHGALAGGNRLQWLKDIERTVAHDRPDWGAVVAAAGDWGASVPTGVMLERARRVLRADVPGDVVARLVRSRGRRAANRVVDRLSPPQDTRSQRSGSALWAQSLRDAAPNAVVLADRLRRRASRDGRLVARVRREADGPRLAVFQPAGDEQARSAFFERVGGSPGGDR